MAAMRAANPASAERLREATDEASLQRAMSDALSRSRSPEQSLGSANQLVDRHSAEPEARRGTGILGRRARLGLAAAAAALAAAILAVGGPSGGRGRPDFAAAAIEVAEANPRLLVSAPGWK